MNDADEKSKMPHLGFRLISLLKAFDFEGPLDAIEREALANGPNLISAQYHAPTNDMCAWASLRWPNCNVILCSGASRISHTNGFANAINNDSPAQGDTGVNSWLYANATAISQQVVASGHAHRTRTIIAGHSLGGAIATALHFVTDNLRNEQVISTVTFGSPRVGTFRYCRWFDSADITRYMNREDPVPNLPPRQSQAPATFRIIGFETARHWNAYAHTPGGYVLYDNGHAGPEDVPNMQSVGLTTSLSGWVLHLSTQRAHPHGLDAYKIRMQRRRALFPVQEPPIGPTGRVHRPPENNSFRSIRAENAVQEAQERAEVEARQRITSRIPRERQFRAVLFGNSWALTFGDTIIAVGPYKSAVRKQALAGNLFLRRLQKANTVAVELFPQKLAEYLAAATTPTTGFAPVMRP